MADVVTYSAALMTDDDRQAIAAYLKTIPASPVRRPGSVDDGPMRRGAEIYSDACASCHLEKSVTIPPLGSNAVAQQADPTGVAHLILAGSRTGTSPSHPSPLTMPAFSDQEIADVAPMCVIAGAIARRRSPSTKSPTCGASSAWASAAPPRIPATRTRTPRALRAWALRRVRAGRSAG